MLGNLYLSLRITSYSTIGKALIKIMTRLNNQDVASKE